MGGSRRAREARNASSNSCGKAAAGSGRPPVQTVRKGIGGARAKKDSVARPSQAAPKPGSRRSPDPRSPRAGVRRAGARAAGPPAAAKGALPLRPSMEACWPPCSRRIAVAAGPSCGSSVAPPSRSTAISMPVSLLVQNLDDPAPVAAAGSSKSSSWLSAAKCPLPEGNPAPAPAPAPAPDRSDSARGATRTIRPSAAASLCQVVRYRFTHAIRAAGGLPASSHRPNHLRPSRSNSAATPISKHRLTIA